MKKSNISSPLLYNRSGFTLIEIIVVLTLISLIGSIAASRFITLDASATEKALDCAVAELNSRECLTWSKTKISGSSLDNDNHLFLSVDTSLGSEYSWGSKDAGGGTLHFRGRTIQLKRTPSTPTMSGIWETK